MKKLHEVFDAVFKALFTTYKVLTSKFFYIPLFLLIISGSVYWFADNYTLRSPILLGFQSLYVKREVPISMLSPIAEAKELKPAKQLTDMEVIETYKLAPVLKGIYMLESSEGKNDGCKDSGKFNGFGFRQNAMEHKCYDSFEEVVSKVNEWLEENLIEYNQNLGQVLCHYNLGSVGGVVPNTCTYSQNFMTVLVGNL